MTKARAPGSIEAAIWAVGTALGWPRAAELACRREKTVRCWSDPDKPELPAFGAAIALDREYDRLTGLGWPIHDAYLLAVAAERSTCPGTSDIIAARTAAILREGGEAHGSLIEAFLPGATIADRHEALEDLIQAAGAITSALPTLRVFASAQAP